MPNKTNRTNEVNVMEEAEKSGFEKTEHRFKEVLQNWKASHPDEANDWGGPAWEDCHHPGRAAAIFAVARSEACSFSASLHQAENKLESPIEYAVLLALLWYASTDMAWTITFEERCDRWPGAGLLSIQPQADLGDYRVDFLLTIQRYDIRTTRYKQESLKLYSVPLIIECDGHEYHEKTKEQARRDKERDRTLQSLGFPVFRFTGSEIWSNSLRCAEQACNHLEQQLTLRIEEVWRAKGIHPDQIGN